MTSILPPQIQKLLRQGKNIVQKEIKFLAPANATPEQLQAAYDQHMKEHPEHKYVNSGDRTLFLGDKKNKQKNNPSTHSCFKCKSKDRVLEGFDPIFDEWHLYCLKCMPVLIKKH